DRHRADGDARATVQLFKLLLAKDSAKIIVKKTLDGILNIAWLNILDELPVGAGVYYVHRNNGDIVYIGKGKNIKSTVNRHFTGDSAVAKAIQKEAAFVTYEETGTMLIAALRAHREIRENSPPYNLPANGSIPEKTARNHSYPHENMIIIDKGRETGERSAFLVENNLFKGFGYFNLNHQIKNIRILRSIITPVEHTDEVNRIIISYLLKNRKLKIVPF
ncbi:MAG: nucleotide excision repair endonuclease, partial [Sinomicrobium sp.]|nr:nucleotide excision repair endonuclease [Sinomicrobium sp.]